MAAKRRYLSIIVLIIVVLLTISVASAHKNAPTASSDDNLYKVSFGLIPNQVVAGESQILFMQVEDELDYKPLSGYHVKFEVYDANETEIERLGLAGMEFDQSPFVGEVYAYETKPGYYETQFTFEDVGSYSVIARVYKGNTIVREAHHLVHAEPNGPSVFFWLYMLMALIGGAILASRSDKLM